MTLDNTTIINPAGSAVVLDTATQVSGRVRAEAGSTVLSYMSITAASWTNNIATFQTICPHNLAPNATFTVSGSGSLPSAYNGQYTAIAGTTGSTLVAALVLPAPPGNVTGPYAGAPAGLPIGAVVASIPRTAAQAPAVFLRSATSCDLDVTLKTGPNGEQFPNAFQVTGSATASLDLRGGDRNFSSAQLLVDASVAPSAVALRNPAPVAFAALTTTLVAALAPGAQVYVTDGREAGQSAGAGTGVFAYKRASDGTMRSIAGGALAN